MLLVSKNQVFKYIEYFLREHIADQVSDRYVGILGFQDYTEEEIRRYMNDGYHVVIYQFEQLSPGCHWMNEGNIAKLRLADLIIDYDLANIEYLRSIGFTNIIHNLIGYADIMDRTSVSVDPIYDVLFCGVITGRRSEILGNLGGRLAHAGYNMSCYYGDLFRDDIISRAKIFLNVHYYEAARQEQARLQPALCNGLCVISEPSIRNYYGTLIVESDLDNLYDTIVHHLRDERWKDFGILARERYITFTDEVVRYNISKINEFIY